MQSIADVLKTFNPVEDKYISREFQSFGIYISEQLDDWKHKALYIRLAKKHPRAVLEKALSFVKDSGAKNKGAYFMWKLKEMGVFGAKKAVKKAPIALLAFIVYNLL